MPIEQGNQTRIGLVENNSAYMVRLNGIMRESGYDTIRLRDGVSVGRFLSITDVYPDLMVVSHRLPRVNAEAVVELVSKFSIPSIVLGDDNSGEFAAELLERGADDYMVRGQFEGPELVARTGALLRRMKIAREPELPTNPIFENCGLRIDYLQHLVTIESQEVMLPATEYKFLAYLARNNGRRVSSEAILSNVWGLGYEDKHLVREYVRRLRAKIEKDPSNPDFIITIPGVGYRMVTSDLPLRGLDPEVKILICPVDKDRVNEISPHLIERKKLDEQIVLEDDRQLNIHGKGRRLINIIRSLPEGMTVLGRSLFKATGISIDHVYYTRGVLANANLGYTIGNAVSPPFEAHYYWKKLE